MGLVGPRREDHRTLSGATRSATGDKLGRWSLYLPPQPAGGPVQMTVAGDNRIILEDVLIGDVWFASGQSNMEMPLSGFPGSAVVKDGANEIRQAIIRICGCCWSAAKRRPFL